MINKYLATIKDALNTNYNTMRIIDMFKTTAELYAHTPENLFKVQLYPESTNCVKFPNEYYRPTSCFRLEHTFTVTPGQGDYIIAFAPGTLFEQGQGKSSYTVTQNVSSTGNKGSRTAKGGSKSDSGYLNQMWDKLHEVGASMFDQATAEGKSQLENYMKTKFEEAKKGFLAKGKGFFDNFMGTLSNIFTPTIKKEVKGGMNMETPTGGNTATGTTQGNTTTTTTTGNTWGGGNNSTSTGNTTLGDLFVPIGIIDEFRIPACVIKAESETTKGTFTAAVTYSHNLDDDIQKFVENPQLITQEWISKVISNPQDGVRVIKIPRDASDNRFKKINHTNKDSEQLIIIRGTNQGDTVVIVTIVQHVEYIPKVEYMDIVRPSIPQFAMNSLQTHMGMSKNMPYIGANGGLIINSSKKVDALMDYVDKTYDKSFNMWDALTDTSSIVGSEQLSILLTDTFY